MPDPYDSIVSANYQRFLSRNVTNVRLRDYYSNCFQDCIDYFGAYQCWACVNCLRNGHATAGWGNHPPKCPSCESPIGIYEIATFQARAPIVGNAFGAAFSFLMRQRYRIPTVPTPGSTRTHDFEVGPEVAIEAKGSPGVVANPDSTTTHLDRPGLERSDTRKKAFDNARTFRQRNPTAYFCVVSNAVPSDLVGYRNRDVNAVFDVTKTDRIEAMIQEIEERVPNLDALRQRSGL